jgi:hypothetical protein
MADAWSRLVEKTAPPAILEATGALIFKYNDLEFALYGVLGCFIPEDAVPALFYELHNTGRVKAINALARERLDDEHLDALAHGLRCFAICTENRNLLAHAWAETHPMVYQQEKITFVKALSGKPGSVAEYWFGTAEIREAAISMDQARSYLYALVDCLTTALSEECSEPLPLPDKPALPRTLSLHRRKEGPLDVPPQPQA